MSEEDLRRRLTQLEAELRATRLFAEAPYQAVVEDMTELVVRWQPDGTRLFVNDAYCRLFQAQREDLIGTSFWPLITDEDREEVKARIARLSPAQAISTGRHRAEHPGGRVVWTEWTDRAIFDADGHGFELHPGTPPGVVPLGQLFRGVPLDLLHARTQRFGKSFGVENFRPPDWLRNSRWPSLSPSTRVTRGASSPGVRPRCRRTGAKGRTWSDPRISL